MGNVLHSHFFVGGILIIHKVVLHSIDIFGYNIYMQTITNYDASFCGKLPLHQINSIQPHGVVILLDTTLKKILQVSENSSELLNKSPNELVNTDPETILTQQSIDQLQQACKKEINEKYPLQLEFVTGTSNTIVFCFLHRVAEGYIIEAELKKFHQSGPQRFIDIYQRVKQVMQHINEATSIQQVCEIAVQQLKQLTGFDKVMVYRFDENWNGFVVAEEAEEGMEHYLGLMFPASDIPKPARDMYRTNPYRIIPNREYEPVRLYPLLNPVNGGFTNLMQADLRSVAGVHIEYLRNMQVMASMSARILHEDQLWGLIACHHRSAKYLSFEECSVVEMISNITSQKLSSLMNSEIASSRHKLAERFAALAEAFVDKTNILEAFNDNATALIEFLHADGVAITWDGIIETEGNTPEPPEIDTLVFWLRQKARLQTMHESQLPAVFEESKMYADKASGILALPIQPDKGNYLIAFRQEVVKTIDWGGNPNDAVQFEKNSTVYHPRHSFSVWQETVHHSARKWREEEVAAAEQLRNFLVQQTLNRLN